MHVSDDDKYFDGNDDDGEMWDDFIFRIYGPFSIKSFYSAFTFFNELLKPVVAASM